MLAELHLPDPSDVEGLCAHLSRHLGRPIRLIATQLPTDLVCGLLVRTDKFDAILYDRRPGQPSGLVTWHQRHVIRHELAHLICGHHLAPVVESDVTDVLLPNVSPSGVRRLLGRTTFSDDAEREVEIIASMLTAAERQTPIGAPPTVVDRVDATLGSGWVTQR
jgi:hypothetical protein